MSDNLLTGELLSTDPETSGHYRIVGTAKRLGVFTQRRVRLLDRETGRLLRETLSDPVTGAYSFEYIAYKYRGYTVMELDWPPTRSDPLNADIADMVTPEPMP